MDPNNRNIIPPRPPVPDSYPRARKLPLIPKDGIAFDIDGVVADIMTTFLDLARERYGREATCATSTSPPFFWRSAWIWSPGLFAP